MVVALIVAGCVGRTAIRGVWSNHSEGIVSSYAYHEFQAVDRPLTEEEQQAVAVLSSRVNLHPWQAVFVYHWSGFRGNPIKVLARYHDAMSRIRMYQTMRILI